MQGNKKVIRVI